MIPKPQVSPDQTIHVRAEVERSIKSVMAWMNNYYIDYFKNNIIEKTPHDAVEYAIVSLSDIEEKVLEMRSCKYSDDIDDYIDFLKNFIGS